MSSYIFLTWIRQSLFTSLLVLFLINRMPSNSNDKMTRETKRALGLNRFIYNKRVKEAKKY